MAICRLLLGKIKQISLPILLTFLLLYLQTSVYDIYFHGEELDNSVSVKSFRTRARNETQTSSHLFNGAELCYTHLQQLKEGSEGEVDAKRTGYVLALNFHEQQTKAANNLFTLQCWAKTLFVNIVEPFVINSHLVIPMNENQRMYVKYREMFDIIKWQVLTAQHRFAPLVSWDQFVARAPRKLIVVQFRYRKPMEYKQPNKTGNGLARLALSLNKSRYTKGCKKSQELDDKIHYMTDVLNFTIVRAVCLNFAQDQLTLFQFNQHVFGGIGPKTVTVLMEEWRGLSSAEHEKRVMRFDGCSLWTDIRSFAYTWPSKQLICDAKKYVHKYFKTESYIALMVRTEKIDNLTGDVGSMIHCLNKTLQEWRMLKKASQIQKTFLSMDIGQYSSYRPMEKKGETKYHPYIQLYNGFLKELFGDYATIKTWEIGFEEVAKKKDPGYISSLQKTITVMSKCVLFIGGGSVQKHTKYMYERINMNNRKCIKIIQECSSGIV